MINIILIKSLFLLDNVLFTHKKKIYEIQKKLFEKYFYVYFLYINIKFYIFEQFNSTVQFQFYALYSWLILLHFKYNNLP